MGRDHSAAHAEMAKHHAIALEGAPLFREADMDLGVFGVCQPTILGLKTVLSALQCHPTDDKDDTRYCAWVCTREEPVVYVGDRPFVLRDALRPRQTMSMSSRAENLEAIEKRLKQDILAEAGKNQGLLLVHEEQENSEELKSMWVAVEKSEVRTVREVFAWVRSQRWRVSYHRLPVAPDQPLEHNYLDAYTQVIKDTDPFKTVFVANCGAGVFRTTFAMIAAVLVRRRQVVLLANTDPMKEKGGRQLDPQAVPSTLGHTLRRVQDNMAQNHNLLRLIYVLSHSLSTKDTSGMIEQLLMQPVLLKSLQEANQGDYGIIRQLCGLLDGGLECKAAVDAAIDACAHVVNLRESILSRRLRYSTAAAIDESQAHSFLRSAAKALEVYYFLIAFASYVEESRTAVFHFRFADWLKQRAEIWRGIVRIRTLHHHLTLFEPVADLSMISRGDASALTAPNDSVRRRFGEVTAEGALVTGDEFAEFVVHNRTGIVLRSGLLLKRDVWREFSLVKGNDLRGVVNFRRVADSNIFGTGQPSVEGINNLLEYVLNELGKEHETDRTVLWINLREEPLVYVSGHPYCLRQRELSLRNITDYSGIVPKRLAQLEERLRQDVVHELEGSDGKLLLHTETEDGTIVPLWEDAKPEDISTMQGVMDQIADSLPPSITLQFRRVPITAEKSVEFSDVTYLLHAVLDSYNASTPIVVNCQLGRGRTTLVSVLILLMERWIQREEPPAPSTEPAPSYHVINSLLRVVPQGQEIKRMVDDAVDTCGAVVNIRDAIERAYVAATEAPEAEQQRHIVNGVQNLRRYFHMMLFQAYLNSVNPGTIFRHTYEQFVRKQPVIATIARDLDKLELATISPLRKMDIGDGMALSDEVDEVVRNRSGTILSASTILKSDFFSGILKAGLPLRIEGMPNLRGVNPLVNLYTQQESPHSTLATAQEVWGCGMPTIDGLRIGLKRMGADASAQGHVVWTNLREEPVLYVNGRPHVLRLAEQPLTNMEATGVTTDVVERMERALQRDLRQEALQREGRVLLHDEVPNDDGDFTIVPVWETVHEADILTPCEVYERMRQEGFRVDYARVAITDEQAPVPNVFAELEERVEHAIETQSLCVFNCQMGRGRTTSGMIIASLIVTVREFGQSWLERGEWPTTSDIRPASEARELLEDELRVDGEYRCILQLVGVLTHGRFAKTLLDRVIDRMETIQNLRKAISMMKLRADNAEPGSKRQEQLRTVFNNYLARYGYLIAFTSYLLDKVQWERDQRDEDSASVLSSSPRRSMSRSMDESLMMSTSMLELSPSFPTWLQKRREITGILNNDYLE
ncbi:hypothetical protein MNAN1_000111 [Malassezia nana]|uniref:Paladin n=1 Tax=Malassezia nana TaxID=180528 RepID=A0AAF0J0U6_9BASI|nr:hypothetical protein MNAN1_000111 [Malassezia nana]